MRMPLCYYIYNVLDKFLAIKYQLFLIDHLQLDLEEKRGRYGNMNQNILQLPPLLK